MEGLFNPPFLPSSFCKMFCFRESEGASSAAVSKSGEKGEDEKTGKRGEVGKKLRQRGRREER